MKPEIIKICGLTTGDAVDAAVAGGATHIGMIFFDKSPRHLDLGEAATLSAHAGKRIARVAVTVNADDDYLDEIVARTNPDLLQLHGSETPARTRELKARHGLPVIKSFAVSKKDDLGKAKAYRGLADHILFDAKAPEDAELPGGNGVAFDWEVMDQWPASVPYILSGGLNRSNIREALNRSRAAGIDVSSGVEIAPGKKSVELIRQFLRTIENEDECVE